MLAELVKLRRPRPGIGLVEQLHQERRDLLVHLLNPAEYVADGVSHRLLRGRALPNGVMQQLHLAADSADQQRTGTALQCSSLGAVVEHHRGVRAVGRLDAVARYWVQTCWQRSPDIGNVLGELRIVGWLRGGLAPDFGGALFGVRRRHDILGVMTTICHGLAEQFGVREVECEGHSAGRYRAGADEGDDAPASVDGVVS